MTLPGIDSAAAWGADTWDDFEPIVDPTTELSAGVAKTMAADVAEMTHTIPKAWVHFALPTYTSGSVTCTVIDHDSLWGSLDAVKPTVVETSAGAFTLTWPSSVTDELGALHTLNIRCVNQPALQGSTNGFVKIVGVAANYIMLQAYNTSWSADDLNEDYISVSWV